MFIYLKKIYIVVNVKNLLDILIKLNYNKIIMIYLIWGIWKIGLV